MNVPEDFARDFADLYNNPETVELVQLASRHPGAIKTQPIKTAILMARNLQRLLATTPALQRVAEDGWDQTQDLPSINSMTSRLKTTPSEAARPCPHCGL
jgi:hypothetical protein